MAAVIIDNATSGECSRRYRLLALTSAIYHRCGQGQQPVPDTETPLSPPLDRVRTSAISAGVRGGAKAGSPERSFIARLPSLPFLR
jgi:hypothetical protein